MRRVPVVVGGDEVPSFVALVEAVRADVGGFDGLLLDVADSLGPEPSVYVDTGGAFDAAAAAVHAGHAAATADLRAATADAVALTVLLSDRRLRLSAAVPIADLLLRAVDTADEVTYVEVPDEAAARAVTALLAREGWAPEVRMGSGYVVRTAHGSATLTGTTDPARALLADVLAFAREADEPWRAHRRAAFG